MLLVRGSPEAASVPGSTVRPLGPQDVEVCAAISRRVHGFERSGDVRDALHAFKPFVIERNGRVTGYLTSATFWQTNHGVAETEDDMRALLAGTSHAVGEPIAFLVPIRNTDFFRWCLSNGMRVIKPMTLMTMGAYQEPAGAYFPNVFY